MTKVVDGPSLASLSVREKVFESLHTCRFTDVVDGREKQILVGAFHCIAEVGIAATTTRAVAQRADLNQGSIHYYFRSKDKLLLGLLKGLMKNSAGILRTIRDADLTPTEKLYCVLRSGATFIQSDELIVLISLWAHAYTQGGEWRSAYRQPFTELRSVLTEIVDEGIKGGDFRPADSKIIAETILTAVQGIGMHYRMMPSDFSSQSLGDRLFGLFSNMLLPRLAG